MVTILIQLKLPPSLYCKDVSIVYNYSLSFWLENNSEGTYIHYAHAQDDIVRIEGVASLVPRPRAEIRDWGLGTRRGRGALRFVF